jgi:hypothetical protein
MIAIGTSYYPADAGSEHRQARSRASLLRLADLIPVNLQFVDEPYRPDGVRTLSVLRRDSRTVTGAREGARKPIVSEMFDALAGVARSEGCRYFAYLNADIEVAPAALEIIREGNRDGYAFSRVDVDPVTGAEIGVEIYGLDMFAVDAAWWTRERRRFRPYIAGEACWDNVYASVICAHGSGAIVNDRAGIFHERHAAQWHDGPFAEHNGFLAALDAPYFSRWCHYAAKLDESLKAGAPVDRQRLAEEILGDARLSAGETVRHAARQLRARFNYARRRAAARPRRR